MKRILAGLLVSAGAAMLATPVMASTVHPIGDVNIRSGPGTQYAVIGLLQEGTWLNVEGREGTWLKVRTATGAAGYVADWVTRELYNDAPAYLQVDTDILNIRQSPDAAAPILGQVVQGDRLRLLEGVAGWYKVDIGLLGTGWVKREYTYREPLAPATQPPPTPPPDKQPVEAPREAPAKAVVATAATGMYEGRSTGYTKVAPVALWQRLTYLESSEGWVKVANAAGQKGWVGGHYLQITDAGLSFSQQAQYSVREGDWSAGYLRVREVVPGGTGLALRTGPSATAPAARSVQEGQRVKLLQTPAGEYVQVMLEDGATGWVSRNWLKTVPGLPEESVRLRQTSAGVLRLELTGQGAAASVSADGLELEIPLSDNALRRAALQVGQHGVSSLSLERQGLVVRFDQPFHYQVVAQSQTQTVLEIRPELKRVAVVGGLDRATYRFHLQGMAAPWARRSSSVVEVGLPGARLADGVVLPAGVSLEADAGGITARVSSDRTFALKRGDGYVDLVLYAPGLAGKTIVVDPGHGGVETGAVGLAGLLEKEVNLVMALKLKPLLEAAGARVVMTRSADTRCASPADLFRLPLADHLRFDLNCRTVVANTTSADAFLSIHNNGSPSRSMQGTETYWSGANFNAPQSKLLASLIQQELVRSTGQIDRGVREDMFYVIKFTDAPAALAEVAFVSNGWEEKLLLSDAFRQQAAEAMFRALSRYFGG